MPFTYNKKTTIWIALGIIIVLALVGYIYRAQLFGTVPGGDRTELQIQEQLGDLIKGNNFNDCKDINNAYYEKVCINNIALALANEKLDISYCKKMDNELISIAECERQIVLQKSVKEENKAVCDTATDETVRTQCRDGYTLGLAFAKNDVGICGQGETAQLKNDCTNMYLFQKEYIVSQSTFDCTRFAGTDMQQDCKSFAKSTTTTGPAVCASMKSNLFIQYCMSQNM